MTDFTIEYASGIVSEQDAPNSRFALLLELSAAGIEQPIIQSTWSGGDWDFSVYPKEETPAYDLSYCPGGDYFHVHYYP